MKQKMTAISFLLLSLSVWGGITIDAASACAGKPNDCAGKPNGLSMKIMHVYSPESPLYPGNISYEEEIYRLLNQSNARAQRIDATIAMALASLNSNNMSQTTNKVNPLDEIIRPRLEYYPYATYLVQFGLGTFDAKFPASAFKTYYLYIDTGSSLLWVLCEDCRKPGNQCFPTKEPPFPNSQSKSYKPLLCDRHPFCKPGQCKGDFCSEDSSYASGTEVHSILAGETFNFLSSSGRAMAMEGIVFGCAYDTKKIPFGRREDFKVAGILGLAYSTSSFPMQISSEINGVFSFCLSRQKETQTYLRFGADIPQPQGGFRVTKLVLLPGIPYYYVNLKSISVNGQKLLIDPVAFLIKKGGTEGGCVMDNGSSFTSLIGPAHNALVMFLEISLLRLSLVRRPSRPPLKLCYKWPTQGYAGLPTITFHFEGNADLDVKPEDAFIKLPANQHGEELLCLAIASNDVRTIFGSMQQTNYRFIYDLWNAQLKFAPEDCSKNS